MAETLSTLLAASKFDQGDNPPICTAAKLNSNIDKFDQPNYVGAVAGTDCITTKVTGDTQKRFTLNADGSMEWGSGAAVADVTLTRSGVKSLQIGSGGISAAIVFNPDDATGISFSTTKGSGFSNTVNIIAGATAQIRLSRTDATARNWLLACGGGSLSIANETLGQNSMVFDNATGHVFAGVDNGIDLGGASNAWRNFYFKTQTLGPDGTASNPSYSFASATNTGMRVISPNLVFVTGGTDRLLLTPSILQVPSTYSIAWSSGAINASSDVLLVRDTANTLAQRNGATNQTFRVYNTFTDASNGEWGDIGFGSNFFFLRANANGTGTVRNMALRYGATTNVAIQIGIGANQGIILGNTASGQAQTNGTIVLLNAVGFTATAGTNIGVLFQPSYSDGGTNSTIVTYGVNLNPTINYTGASRTGKFYGLYFNPVNTSLPTGQNATIALSNSASTAAGGGGIVLNNQNDEDTNFEKLQIVWSSNQGVIQTTVGGTGTARAIQLFPAGTANILFAVNGSNRWRVDGAAGHFLATTDNANDIGAAGATRPRHVIVGTSVQLGANPATAGALRLANNTLIEFRNAANSADVPALSVDANNHINMAGSTNTSVWLQTAGALATNATTGFVGIPTCAGAPTGVPGNVPTGTLPMIYDTTNNFLYFYAGGAWKKSTVYA